MRRRGFKGFTLIELLMGILIMFISGLALYGLFTVSFEMHDTVIGQNQSFEQARKGIDLAADHLRNAQRNTNTDAGVYMSVLGAASAASVTYYVDTTPTGVVLSLNGTNLQLVDGGNTTVLATDVSSLNLTYYKLTAYNGTWTTTDSPNAPTSAELPKVAGIEIKVTIARDGYTSEYKTMVRLRNSPRKTFGV